MTEHTTRPAAYDAQFPFWAVATTDDLRPATLSEVTETTRLLWPDSALPDLLDAEAGGFNVDLPQPLADEAFEFGLGLDLQVVLSDGRTVRLQFDVDPAF